MQKLLTRFLRHLLIHLIYLVGSQKLMLVMINFRVILNFSNQPSILKIKEQFNKLTKDFFLQHLSETTVRKIMKNLPSVKASAGKIPNKVLKESKFCFPNKLY